MIPRSAWGAIEILASVETEKDATRALARGYDVALVVARFERTTMYTLPGGLRILPCPAQTRASTCVECRACMTRPGERGVVIGFEVHGPAAKHARRSLAVLQSGVGGA